MNLILRSAAFVLCLALRVSSQPPPKPIGEWSPNRAEMYPNPWVDSEKCKTNGTSGLCDYNEILNVTQRTYFSTQPELRKGIDDAICLCNMKCGDRTRIIITVAIMKKIGPHITDYGAAAKEFAETFRVMWSLNNCSVILVASKGDNTGFLDVGPDMINLVPRNVSIETEECFRNGGFVDCINKTLGDCRTGLNKAVEAAQTTEPPTQTDSTTPEAPGGSSTVIIIIVVVGVVVGTTVVIVIIMLRKSRNKASVTLTELKEENERLSDDAAAYEKLQGVPKASGGQSAYVSS